MNRLRASYRVRFPVEEARAVAHWLIELLSPACQRIEIAGSIRRGLSEVGDVELVCIPRTEEQPDLFGNAGTRTDLLDMRIQELLSGDAPVLEYRLNVSGHRTYGPLNKLLRYRLNRLPIDVFSTTPEHWGMALFVRTGPKDWNIRAMSRLRELGREGHAYGGVTLADGTDVPCPTEERVFELLEWGYVRPEGRS